MTRDEFRQQMELYRQAREQNPQLSYWEWKSLLGEIVDKANQSDVNFVDRLNQFNRQTIPDWSGEGDVATHRMSWAEDENGNAIVYPEVQEINGKLHDFTDPRYNHGKWDALDSAIERGDTIHMTPFEAQQFTGGYKNFYPKFDEGTNKEGIQSNTSEIPVTYSNGKWNYGYNPGAGFLKPVVSIQDAADLTPVGNAIMANDVYQSANQGDYITAGLISAAALLPGAISKPLKKIVREIPSVNPKYFSDKINKVLGREVRPNGLSRDIYTDAINQRNRVIEDLYTDQDYWDRARTINEQYGDDYTKVYKGVIDTYENKYTGLPEPKAKQFFGDAKAEMAARKDAMERFRMNKIPAGYTDFEYNISPHLDRIDRPTAQHELGHYVDFNLSQNANADYNNNMFSALRRDLSTDNNPLYPDKTDYFRQGTEQKSYMNTLRSYMQSIGLMDRPGQKVTTKTIKRAINSLPSEMNAVRAAYLQFSSPGKYTKWFNKIPLLSIPGAAMYFDSKEDNSYSDGTDGIYDNLTKEQKERVQFGVDGDVKGFDSSLIDEELTSEYGSMSFYAGELPEITIKPQQLYATLNTYYPAVSEYPFTGHSELITPLNRIITATTRDDDYNLITKNCSDATRCAINNALNLNIKPLFFTTPGDIKDAVSNIKGTKGVYKNGVYTQRIPISNEQARKLEYEAYKRNRQSNKYLRRLPMLTIDEYLNKLYLNHAKY